MLPGVGRGSTVPTVGIKSKGRKSVKMCKICRVTKTRYSIPHERLAPGFSEGLSDLNYLEAERRASETMAAAENDRCRLEANNGRYGQKKENRPMPMAA